MPLVGPKSVYLGSDTSLNTTKYGDKGTNSTGFQYEEISDLDAQAYVDGDKARAEVGANGGEGSLTAWAYIGRSIFIEDSSGSQDATFTFRGELYGSLTTDSASNYVGVEMTVEDYTDDEYYEQYVYQKSDYIGSITEDPLVHSMNIPLEAQHEYGVMVKVTAEITTTGEIADNAISDFYPDSYKKYLGWNVVDISFN